MLNEEQFPTMKPIDMPKKRERKESISQRLRLNRSLRIWSILINSQNVISVL